MQAKLGYECKPRFWMKEKLGIESWHPFVHSTNSAGRDSMYLSAALSLPNGSPLRALSSICLVGPWTPLHQSTHFSSCSSREQPNYRNLSMFSFFEVLVNAFQRKNRDMALHSYNVAVWLHVSSRSLKLTTLSHFGNHPDQQSFCTKQPEASHL